MTIKIKKSWEDVTYDNIIDVRSPSEYQIDHIGSSINCPVLYDEERKKVGTIYKVDDKFKGKIKGAALISKNISHHIEKKFINKKGNWKPLIYCWRGGQRSKSLALVLSEIGWEVSLLKGGYKAYRNSIIKKIDRVSKGLNLIVLSGSTGSAKTRILEYIKSMGENVLNLEKLANHRGSLLGAIPNSPQPSQKFFESKLYNELIILSKSKNSILVESESSKIGNLFLPSSLIKNIKTSPTIEINVPSKVRAEYLVKDYENILLEDNFFSPLFNYAKKNLSKDIITYWIKLYQSRSWKELAESLIKHYYDPLYSYNNNNSEKKIINKLYINSLENNNIKIISKDIVKIKNNS